MVINSNPKMLIQYRVIDSLIDSVRKVNFKNIIIQIRIILFRIFYDYTLQNIYFVYYFLLYCVKRMEIYKKLVSLPHEKDITNHISTHFCGV